MTHPPPSFSALMCSLSFCFGLGLTGTHPTLFFFCSHVFFLFFGPGLTGTHPTLFFLCSHVFSLSYFFGPVLTGTHPCFSGMHVLGWFRCPMASSCYRSIEFTHLLHLMSPLFVCLSPGLTGTHPPPSFSALMCSLSFCFGLGLSGTYPTLFFLCSHVFFLFVLVPA